MIDLHSHTNESDGTYSAAELVDAAMSARLDALAVTDHDTLAGYDLAEPLARAAGLDLVCGIEISTRFHGRSVHLLGYFVNQPPAAEFREWLGELQSSRRDRNQRLIKRLRSLGVDISLEEVVAKGRSMTGRPHFARVLVEKGYVTTIDQAFEDYLDESAKGYVQRREVPMHEGIERVLAGGGIPSLAHPIRVGRRVGGAHDGDELDKWVGEMRDMGLRALEAFHSDHRPQDVQRYLDLARRLDLAVTGGSDFHGANKPRIELGRGYEGNLSIPRSVLDNLRAM
ncbi:MAG TPA: PHP domain-containing protein [Bryobacteraceae bacterium]|nr:PHP domain-containing protein [Bryobacteraceae bacterium]